MSEKNLDKIGDEDSIFEDAWYEALCKFGYIFPETEEQLKDLKAKISKEKISLPIELKDPFKIIENGRITSISSLTFDNKEIEENMAMAAREGKEIPEDILKQMAQDRNEAEEKKDDIE
jgi:hypothetical protein